MTQSIEMVSIVHSECSIMLVAIIFFLLKLLFSQLQINLFSDCGMDVSRE